ncbi:MAG: hypothetical protein ACO1N0_20715 [Fluviicola sp.]
MAGQSSTDFAWNTSSSVGIKSPKNWLSTVNLDFFGDGLTTSNPVERYFDPAWRTPEMIAGYKGTENLANLFAGTTTTIVMLPLALEYGSVTLAQLSGESGVTAQVGAWYRMANTAADATSQAIDISANGGSWNWASTFGNSTFNNPFASAAPGSLYSMAQDPHLNQNISSHLGNYALSLTGNYLSGKVGSVPIPLMSGGMKHGVSGFALPLMFNAASTGIKFPTP